MRVWGINNMARLEKDERANITFSLSKTLFERLQLFISESGLSQSSVIREAIDAYLRSKVSDRMDK